MNTAYIGPDGMEQAYFTDICKNTALIRKAKCYGDFNAFLKRTEKNEELNLIFFDLSSEKDDFVKKIEFVCAEYSTAETVLIAEDESFAVKAFEMGVFGYMVRPYSEKDIERVAERYIRKRKPENRTVFIRTFGRFDVFVGENVIHFSNKKSKELLAMLVDRCGGSVTMEQVIDTLWEERVFDECTKALYRIALKNLRDTLKREGCAYILNEKRGERSVNTEKVNCDYFSFLKNPEAMDGEFNGEYMLDYAWGEYTLAQLMKKSKKIF